MEAGSERLQLSVLIPVYNHEQYVSECIRSIWAQDVPGVEIVAIDDGSSDGSYRVLEQLQRESPVPLRIRTRPNRGVIRTANELLGVARGDYVLCMASDDKLLPGTLRPALECVRAGGLQFAMFNARYFGDVERAVYSPDAARVFTSETATILRRLYVDPPQPMLLQSTVIDRRFLVELGGWSESVVLDDWPMFIRFFEQVAWKGAKFRFYRDLHLTGYRIHPTNAHKDLGRQLRLCEEVVRTHCPPELRSRALTHTYVAYALSAARRRDPEGARLLRKALLTSGWWAVAKSVWTQVARYYGRRLS